MIKLELFKDLPYFEFKFRNNITKKTLTFVIAAILLAGCGTISTNEQPAKNELFQFNEHTSLGQTFLSRYDGLNGISIFINPVQTDNLGLHLELYENFGDSQPIRTSDLFAAGNLEATYYNFDFPPIKNSANEDYYFRFIYEGPGSASVAGDAGNTYLNGAFYVEEQPQNSQMAFNLDYSPSQLALGLIGESLHWFSVLAAGIFLIGIPGWAVLSWLFPQWRKMNWVTKFALSLGVGIAVYPVLFLWSNIFSLQLGAWFAWTLPLVCLLSIIWRRFRDYKIKNRNTESEISETTTPNEPKGEIFWRRGNLKNLALKSLPDLGFLIAAAFITFTRFWPIRSLDAAMWGDSYQHTLIAQLIVDNGGLFNSWLPYTELSSFTYHFGLHAITAAYQWLSGVEITQAVLWIGQLLNIFAIITIYPLAVLIGKNRWAGVFALLVAGLVSPMPMYYTNWGRFTQLAGQVILPALIVMIWMNLKTKRINWKWNSLIWITLAGLSLSHYRVILFIPLFYISYLLLGFREAGVVNTIKRAAIHALGAIVLIFPWLVGLFEGKLPEIYGNQVLTSAAQVSQAIQEYNAIGDISGYLPIYLWILMIIAIIWGILQRNRNSNIFSLWWILIFSVANPGWLRLPGTGVVSNFAIFIAAYIPAGVLIGSAAGSFLADFGQKGKREDYWHAPAKSDIKNKKRFALLSGVALILVIAISLVGFRKELAVVKPSIHSLVTRPDVRAGQWIDENLPEHAKFLVNSFFAYGGSLVVGSDAGWWLPLIASRQTTLPPLNYSNESSSRADFIHETNDLVAGLQEKGINNPESIAELLKRNVTHVYIGQQRGKVNASEPPILIARELKKDPNFRLIYNQDRVLIFELLRPDG